MSPVQRTILGGVVWGLVAACIVFVAIPGLVSAERNDPLPSPLYQHSLQTSIEKFDGPIAGSQTNARISRERAESGGSGSSRASSSQNTIDDCWLSQALFIISLDPTPSGCNSGEFISFNTADPLVPDIMRRPPPPYLPAPNPPDIPIEIVQLELRGAGVEYGEVRISKDPLNPAPGAVRGVTTDAGGNFQSAVDCFFDIFYRIDFPDLGVSGHTQIPIEMVALNLTSLPPIGHQFATQPSQPPVPIVDANNIQIGWICGVPGYRPAESIECPVVTTPTMEGAPSCHGASTCAGFYTCMNATCAAIQTCRSVTCTAEPTCAGSESTCSGNPTCAQYPSCIGTATCELQGTCIGQFTCRGTGTCPGAPTCDQPPTYEAGTNCEKPTLPGGPSCHGSSTCTGSYTCWNHQTCGVALTCDNPTCTSEPTCTPRSSTCSYTPTCPLYPSCEGTATCGASNATCVGSSTCRGSTTCEGTSTCEPPAPTLSTYETCEGFPTCEGSLTCSPDQVTCVGSISCGGPGGYTCSEYQTCDGNPTCTGAQTCDNTPTCSNSCDAHSCEYPTSANMYTCGDGACPTSQAQASCPGSWLCPTYSGYYTCPSGSCITSDGTVSCTDGPACITWSNYFTCHVHPCPEIPPPVPTYAAYYTCRPANCPTWLGSTSCPGGPCPNPTLAPNPSCGGAQTCAAVPCIPTIPGAATCAGANTCAPNQTCNAFGTCPGWATCAPAGTCGANTCPNFNTCAGFATCANSVTCQGGHTCAPNITCPGVNTCGDASTCQGVPTCDISPTCGGWPSCGTFACLTSAGGVTCGGQETCTGAASCASSPTCDGSPTCALAFTCTGWPTCQAPPYDIPCDLKLCLDSLREQWVRLNIPPDSTQAFEWFDWHGGPIHPLLIWDEMSPKIPGVYVITEWQAPPIIAGVVDTEYVQFPYWVDSIHVLDADGDVHVSVGDFLLLKFASPAAINGQTAWFQVTEIGKSRPQDKKYIVKLQCARPLAIACECDCHADPECDGVPDILDVIAVVNVAFRGAAPIPDPNPLCPFETTDVNCSNSTDVLDVVLMVNVIFRGANPATEYCNPCP